MSIKSMLKDGAIVQCRNGERFIKIGNTLLARDGGYIGLDGYGEDLLIINRKYSNWDIVKFNNDIHDNDEYCNEPLRQVVMYNEWSWERPTNTNILTDEEKKILIGSD